MTGMLIVDRSTDTKKKTRKSKGSRLEEMSTGEFRDAFGLEESACKRSDRRDIFASVQCRENDRTEAIQAKRTRCLNSGTSL